MFLDWNVSVCLVLLAIYEIISSLLWFSGPRELNHFQELPPCLNWVFCDALVDGAPQEKAPGCGITQEEGAGERHPSRMPGVLRSAQKQRPRWDEVGKGIAGGDTCEG